MTIRISADIKDDDDEYIPAGKPMNLTSASSVETNGSTLQLCKKCRRCIKCTKVPNRVHNCRHFKLDDILVLIIDEIIAKGRGL